MRVEEGVELAQAVIQLGDIVLQRHFRQEERSWRTQEQSWRSEDRKWREQDLDWRDREADFMAKQQEWRIKDLQQRSVDNARILWSRFVEKNRRDVEERAEQLKSVGNSSALIAGFAVVAFLEFNVEWESVPVWLEVFFGLTTALVVGLNAQAMVTSSLMHASILRSGKTYVSEEAEAEFMSQCLLFETHFELGRSPPAPTRTFAQHWETRCEADWQWAFSLFSAGLVAFIANLMIAAWLKFRRTLWTPAVVTAALAVCMIGMAMSLFSWAPHLFHTRRGAAKRAVGAVQPGDVALGLPFDWHRVPSAPAEPSLGQEPSGPGGMQSAMEGFDLATSASMFSHSEGGETDTVPSIAIHS